jgi:hypothetical protein
MSLDSLSYFLPYLCLGKFDCSIFFFLEYLFSQCDYFFRRWRRYSAVVVADIACVVKAMVLRSSAIAIIVLTSCIIFLFLLSYEILHPELPGRECDHCGGHSESRVFDHSVPEFVLSSSYFLYQHCHFLFLTIPP